jgi:hypothetical protein
MDYRQVARFLGTPAGGGITGRDVLTRVRTPAYPDVAWDGTAYEWKPGEVLAAAGLVAPVVTALVPPSAVLGSANFTLHVQGTNFTPGARILWNGAPEPTTFVSPTELTTGVNMATAQVAMPIPVSVEIPDVLVTNALTFTLLAAE